MGHGEAVIGQLGTQDTQPTDQIVILRRQNAFRDQFHKMARFHQAQREAFAHLLGDPLYLGVIGRRLGGAENIHLVLDFLDGERQARFDKFQRLHQLGRIGRRSPAGRSLAC